MLCLSVSEGGRTASVARPLSCCYQIITGQARADPCTRRLDHGAAASASQRRPYCGKTLPGVIVTAGRLKQDGKILQVEVHTQDGMEQGQESEGRLSYLRPADRLLPAAVIGAGSLGTGSRTACQQASGSGTGSDQHHGVTYAV